MPGSDRPLSEVEFVAFDLETTGLYADSDRILEIGATRFRLSSPDIAHFEQLVQPECAIPREVIAIHGITDRMVLGQPTLAEVLPQFLQFLGSPDTILLAHNAPFDIGFVVAAMGRLGLSFPAHAVVDTVVLARTCLRGAGRYRLADLTAYLRLADREEHRGLSDARLVAGLFSKIVARTKSLRTVDDLYRLTPPLRFARGARR
jgi:DNA polymerase-3 subunit epsilon